MRALACLLFLSAGCFDYDAIVCKRPPQNGTWSQVSTDEALDEFSDGPQVFAVGGYSTIVRENGATWAVLPVAGLPEGRLSHVLQPPDGSLIVTGNTNAGPFVARLTFDLAHAQDPRFVVASMARPDDLANVTGLAMWGNELFLTAETIVPAPGPGMARMGALRVMGTSLDGGETYAGDENIWGVTASSAGVFVCGYNYFARWNAQTQKLDALVVPYFPGGGTCQAIAAADDGAATKIWAVFGSSVCVYSVLLDDWTCRPLPITVSFPHIAISPCDPEVIAVSGVNGSVALSTDGESFKVEDSSMPSDLSTLMVSRQGAVYAAGLGRELCVRR